MMKISTSMRTGGEFRTFELDPPIPVYPDDEIHLRGQGKPPVRVVRYKDLTSEPEWEIFV